MNWLTKKYRIFMLKRKLRSSIKALYREQTRWANNYDCGATLYDHITVGRLGRAEKRVDDASDEIRGFCIEQGLDPGKVFGLYPDEQGEDN